MGIPVTLDMIAGFEADAPSALFQVYTGGSGTNPCAALNDPVAFWTPLAAGNALGDLHDATAGARFKPNAFGAGMHGVFGNSAGQLVSLNALPALLDWDLYIGYKTTGVASSNFDRMIESDFVTGLHVLIPSGAPTSIACGYRESSSPFGAVLASADNAPHILHMAHRTGTTTRLAELDGHITISNTLSSSSALALAATQMFLMSSSGGSTSTATVQSWYLYGRTTAYGGQSTLEVNKILNYMGGPARLNIALNNVPATGGNAARGTLDGGFTTFLRGGF